MSLFRKTITLGRVSALAAILSFASAAAVANAQATPLTPLDKQLSRLDLAVSGMGSITKSTTGPQVTPPSTTITDDPSNTVGALVTLRYIKSPLVGLEFNYTYARFNQNFGYFVQNPGEKPLAAKIWDSGQRVGVHLRLGLPYPQDLRHWNLRLCWSRKHRLQAFQERRRGLPGTGPRHLLLQRRRRAGAAESQVWLPRLVPPGLLSGPRLSGDVPKESPAHHHFGAHNRLLSEILEVCQPNTPPPRIVQ